MRSIVRIAVGLLCATLASTSALAQVTIDIAPTSYAIQRFPNADWVEIVTNAPTTLSGGDTININVRLPQPLGIDLAQASSFNTYLIFQNPAGCSPDGVCAVSPPFFDDLPATAGYYTAAGALIPPFSNDVWVAAYAGGLQLDTTHLSRQFLQRVDFAPFNGQFGSFSQVRASFDVPNYFQTTSGLQLIIDFIAERNSADATTILVQGKDVGILQTVADTITALEQAGVDPGKAAELGAALRAALESLAAGDNAGGSRQLHAFFDAIDALVDSGEMSNTQAHALRPAILKEAAALRNR
jgi:hypothetical protein